MIALSLPTGPALPQTWPSASHCRDQYSVLQKKPQNEICPSAPEKANYFQTQQIEAAIKEFTGKYIWTWGIWQGTQLSGSQVGRSPCPYSTGVMEALQYPEVAHSS